MRLPARITCVISSLGNGGAERVMATLCGAFAAQGSRVTLLTLDDGTADFHPVPSGVTRVALGVMGESRSRLEGLTATVSRITALRRALRHSRPDVVLSFMDRTNVLVLLATRGTGLRVVAAERNNPWMLPMGAGWEQLRRVTYRWAAAVTVQSGELRDFFGADVAPMIVVIPNSVSPAAAHPTALRETLILAAGRLEPQKGFDLLLRAFARVHRAHPGWCLRIVGEGSERARLERLRAELGLGAASVALPGRTSRMSDEYARAGVFVLSSRFEGFPNVLCEAMAHGCPVVATRCRTGPSEIVRDGVDGVLVPVDDIDGLAAGIMRLVEDAPLRASLGDAARALPSRFPEAAILEQWASVLARAAGTG